MASRPTRSWRRPAPGLLLAVLLLAVGAAGGACVHASGLARAIPECPGDWVATQEIPGDFLLRQQMLVTRGNRVFALHLVVQKRGDELVLVGLHPFGAKLFTLRQRGLETSVEAVPAPVLEVPPLNVLRDLHRARFLGLGAADGDGTFEEQRDGTEVREHREGGRLRWRRFRRLDGDPEGVVELRFEPTTGDAQDGERVTIDNGWCGYRAELTTVSAETLP